jgi:biotin-(acetyl-CoA carboxylase) ligase
LCERIRNADLIGVGINVNTAIGALPKSLRQRSASLIDIIGHPTDLNVVLSTIARHIFARLSRHNEHHFGAVLREYHRHHALVGRRIEVISGNPADGLGKSAATKSKVNGDKRIKGVCVGLDTIGRLMLRDRRDASRVHRIVAGNVLLRRELQSSAR